MTPLKDIRALIIDMDGVLWRGKTLLPGVAPFFAYLRERRLPFVLATNNATADPAVVSERLGSAGVKIEPPEILDTAQATAAYLQGEMPAGSPVLMIGEQNLQKALKGAGFEVVDRSDSAQAVVVGYDRQLTWKKLAEATLAIHAGARFIGTNPDVTFPSERGLLPGNGAAIAALQAATGVEPEIVGKPEPHLYRQAMERLSASPERTLAVGDRLETDILGAQRAGTRSALLLSGVTTRAQAEKSPIRADWIFEGLPDLLQHLQDSGV